MRRALLASLLTVASCTPGAPEMERSQRETPLGTGAADVPPAPSDPAEDEASSPPAPGTGRDGIEAWLMWTLGGLPAGLADAVRALPEIGGVAEVASGTTWLLATGSERVPDRGGAGFAIPFEIAAARPREYARLLPPAHRGSLLDLGRNEALLGRTAATLRGIRVGGLALREGNIGVRGVIADRLIGAHEAIVPWTTGVGMGLGAARYLLAEPTAGAQPDRIRHALASVVPEGLPVRIRAPGGAAWLRHADLTLPQSRLKALFGEFAAAPSGGWLDVDPTWVRRNIEDARVPILGRMTCHRRIVPLVRGALRELVRRGRSRLVDPAQYGGCYAPRFIGRDPGAGLSHHAWGVAIDINVADNPLGAEPTMDPRVVRTFERWGFVWGGDFIRPDGHHFEFRCFPDRCRR